MGKLQDRVAIVTGAASGIGRETAELFAREGARVLAVDRNAAGLDSLRAEAAGKGLTIATHVADLLDPSSPAAIFAAAVDQLGPVDVLANIAGLASDSSLENSTDEDFEKFVAFNLGVTFRMCREAVKHFGDRGGTIVNTSSAVALVGMTGTAPYSAAKAGVTALTRQLAADYGQRHIRVNAVAPGLIDTPATHERLERNVFAEAVDKLRPLPRVGRPIDIANAFAFLASDESSFITGVTLPVCGGWSTTRYRAR